MGLGDIGPEAGLPVMEGKSLLFKTFGNIDSYPLCIRSKDTEEIIKTIKLFAGSWGGITLKIFLLHVASKSKEDLKKN